MRSASTNERVGNVVKGISNHEEIESNMEIGREIIGSSVETEGYRTGYNVETKGNSTKKCLHNMQTKIKGKLMHKSYAEIFGG